jgi:hypothetical protein
MFVVVEPTDGPELDRAITSLLNVTGVVHQVIESVLYDGYDGVDAIDEAASRIRGWLTVFAEHHDDDELEVVTRLLATITLIVGEELDLGDMFAP